MDNILTNKKINPKKLSKYEKGQIIEGARKRDKERAKLRKTSEYRKKEKDVYNEYLKKGKEYHDQKNKDREADANAYAWEAAGYVQNKLRGAISIVPCLSKKFCENYDKIDWSK